PYPAPGPVRTEARELIKVHDEWLRELERATYDPKKILNGLKARLKDVPPTWEQATQLALAVAALKRGEILKYQQEGPGATKPADLAALEEVLKALSFPRGSESPSGIEGPLPTRRDVQKKFQALLDALGK